jgi:YfiH family protein
VVSMEMERTAARDPARDGALPEDGPLFWEAPFGSLPSGARFALTTRRGGVSEGPFARLNVGLRVGDREEAVLENIRRVRAAAGMSEDEPLRVRQVHGTAIVEPSGSGSAADGFLVAGGDPWVAVSVADCAPVALVSRDGARGALLHSGWRGTVDGIGVRAVEALARRGVDRAGVHAVIGPCIHACCYPVGNEVARRVPTFLLKPHPSGRFALDLPGAIAAALGSAGVSPARITIAPECTACRPDAFYSHRRDAGVTGRHWAILRLGTASTAESGEDGPRRSARRTRT